MAPKRGGRRVVKTTKVVEETVEVQIIGSQSQEDPTQPKIVEEVSKIREEQTQTTTLKSIPVEGDSQPDQQQDEGQDTETQEPEFPLEEPKLDKIGTPPREEAPAQPRKRGRPKAAQEKETTAKKAKEEEGRERKTRRRRRSTRVGEGYRRYVFRVLKQVHPGMGISSKAMTVVNNLMSDMFEKLAMEASKLNMYCKKNTMTSREIQSATKLILPGELGKHAIAEGSKAVSNYMTFDKK